MFIVAIAVLLPIKSSSNDDSALRYGFEAESSLPQIKRGLEIPHNITKL